MDSSGASAHLAELEAEFQERRRHRESNLPLGVNVSRNDHEKNKKNLKADARKASTFVNKLKAVNTEGLQQCIRDTDALNLKQFVTEIVAAIMEANFKMTDVPLLVKLCTCLHRRYEEFPTDLIGKLLPAILAPIREDEDKDSGKKRRVLMRFAIELFAEGVFDDAEFFVTLIQTLRGKVKKPNTPPQPMDIISIQIFIKYGAEAILGLPSRVAREMSKEYNIPLQNIPLMCFMPDSLRDSCKQSIQEVFNQVINEYKKAYVDLTKKERRCNKDRAIFGTLTEAKQQELDISKRNFERILTIATGMADGMGEDLPELVEEKDEEDTTAESSKTVTVWDGNISNTSDGYQGPFGDAETRSFYEDFPDILNIVPQESLGISPEQAQQLKEKWKQKKESRYGAGSEANKDNTVTSESVESAINNDDSNVSASVLEAMQEAVNDLSVTEKSIDGSTAPLEADDTPHAKITVMLEDDLPKCTSKAKCDEFCVKFCFLNSRGARRRLAEALLRIPWGRGDLPPFYARVLATLSRLYPEMSKPILESLQREVTFLLRAKVTLTPGQREAKCRILRYMGELIKFDIAPPIMALKCIRGFLEDCTNFQSVELLGAVLESCGRFLYMLPFTHATMEEYLRTMLRLRKSRITDLRLQTMIDSAYFAVKPPNRKAKKAKVLTTVQKYIQYIMFDKLCNNATVDNVDEAIMSLRRLPFNDPSHPNLSAFIVKCALKLSRFKYGCIGTLADCFSGLSEHRPSICTLLIDSILEEIFRGLESPYKRDPQRMIGLTKFIGELFNFNMISNAVIMDVLYSFIHYGHVKDNINAQGINPGLYTNGGSYSYTGPLAQTIISSMIANKEFSWLPSDGTTNNANVDEIITQQEKAVTKVFAAMKDYSRFDPKVITELDPPQDLFRAQLVVELINACGEFFVSGGNKNKLENFLLYFQRYLNSKVAIPLHTEYAILDMYDRLEEEHNKIKKVSRANEVFVRYMDPVIIQTKIDEIEAKIRSNLGVVDEEEEEAEVTRQQKNSKGSSHDNDCGEGDDDNDDDDNEENSSDESGSDDSSDDSEDDEDMEISDQQASEMLNKMRVTEEDEEFERAFKSMLVESYESATSRTAAVRVDKMMRPAVLPTAKNATRIKEIMDSSTHSHTHHSINNGQNSTQQSPLVFKMLSRDARGKYETRQLLVPRDNAIAENLAKNEEAARLEKQLMKEKTLQLERLHAQEAEEDDDQDGSGNAGGSGGNSIKPTRKQPQTIRLARANNNITTMPYKSEEIKKPGDLNLDDFLAETSAAEVRRVNSAKQAQNTASSYSSTRK